MPTLKEVVVKETTKKAKTTKGSTKAKAKSKAKVKATSDNVPHPHVIEPRMVVSPNRQSKMKAITQMNRAASRRPMLPDFSDEDAMSDDEPVYQSKKGTKTTGLDDDEDVLMNPLIRTPPKIIKKRFVESPSDKTNKYAVHSVVGTELFPRVKFLDSTNDLIYSRQPNTICDFVLSRCKLALDVNEEVFWEKAKDWVKKCLARHRSDKATACRNVFHGKLICVCIDAQMFTNFML